MNTDTLPEDLMPWLREQLAKAEKSLRAREQLEEVNRRDQDALWEKWSKMPGVVITKAPQGAKVMSKEERIAEANKHRRIAAKDRRDVEMFKAVLAALEPGR